MALIYANNMLHVFYRKIHDSIIVSIY